MKNKPPHIVKSVSELHALLGLPRPKHPLISLYRYDEITLKDSRLLDFFCPQFYCIAIKKNFKGKVRYGHSYYDFDEGLMCFIGPGQLLAQTAGANTPEEGFCIMFHPDFLAGYPLMTKIKNYHFFSYELNEALHLSDDEVAMVERLVEQIRTEYESRVDILSQDVMIAHLELLLHYSQRFYNRQFITRKIVNTDLLVKLDRILEDYLKAEAAVNGLPTVKFLAAQLNLSPNYLGDMLRATTGMSTQQHIQNKLIEKAKEWMLSSNLSLAEIAYQLGFERQQSLTKLFKNVAGVAPSQYRSNAHTWTSIDVP